MKTLVIMQPTYLPWIGYFDLMKKADIFVIYDHVQFSKQSWQQRNRIRNQAGEVLLTLPVLAGKKEDKFQAICEVRLDYGQKFIKKQLGSLQHAYARAPFFETYFPEIQKIFEKKHEFLTDLNTELILFGKKVFGLSATLLLSQHLDVPGTKVESLVYLCEKLDAQRYLSPAGSREYIEENNLFLERGIQLEYHSFQPPKYPQLNYPDFIPYLCFLDYLFNVGPTAWSTET